ncbi:MAG: hypothetical protein QF886_22165, partial [Planctomycetota bacterium]|nr:hypothetical protein [Planctomycetota bacterium]
RSNRYEEAKQRFEEAIKAEEGERKYFYQYGKALNYMGEYEAAITQLERATEPPFPYRAAYGVWASSLNQLGRSAEAVSLLTKIIRYRKTSSSTYAKTVRQTFQGLDQVAYLQARDSVIHHVKELRTEIASTWLPDLYLAATLAEMGDIEAATGLLYHLELFVPWRDRLGWLTRSSTDYSKWGWAYLAAEKPDLAVLKFRSAILADSENKDAYQGLALAYLKLDKGDRAESSLKALMEIFPNRASNLSDFAEAFERNGQYAKAVEYYAKSIEAGNTSKSTALDAVLAYIQAGETQRGLDLIELLNSKEGSEGRYYRERTRSYLAAGEWERADAAVKTMLTRSRSSSTNRQLAGFFELGRGDYREAEAHFKCSRRNGKRDSVMRVLETLCHTLQQGKFAKPEAVNGRLPWPEMATAFIEGRASEQQLMRQATHLVNDRNRRERLALAHYVIAETLLASGSREKAIYHYREGLAQRQFRSP